MPRQTTTRPRPAKRGLGNARTLYCGFHFDSEAERDEFDAMCRSLQRTRSQVCRMAIKAFRNVFAGVRG